MLKSTFGRAPGGLARFGAAAALAALTALAAEAAHAGDLCNTTNALAVASNPASHRTPCNLSGPAAVTQLITYHWNNGRGAAPGTISLINASTGQTYGPFRATGSSGQGGAPNVNWTANVNLSLPAGQYQVVDSDPATWSWNGASGGYGFARVEGTQAAPVNTPIGPRPGVNPGLPGRPPVIGGAGGGGINGGGAQQVTPIRWTAPQQTVCVHRQYLYTLHVKASDGSTSIVVQNVTSAPPGIVSAGYDAASTTVEGYGLKVGAATVTVTGYVEAVNGHIPFVVTLPVTVRACD
jgi:hypothetical protein